MLDDAWQFGQAAEWSSFKVGLPLCLAFFYVVACSELRLGKAADVAWLLNFPLQ